MKGIKAALVLLIVAHLIGAGLTRYAQPNISKDNIPPDVPADVREKIEALYSPDPLERAEAAAHLGLTGHRAAPAIPFLIGMFGDEALLVEDPPGSFRHPRYPVDAANTLLRLKQQKRSAKLANRLSGLWLPA